MIWWLVATISGKVYCWARLWPRSPGILVEAVDEGYIGTVNQVGVCVHRNLNGTVAHLPFDVHALRPAVLIRCVDFWCRFWCRFELQNAADWCASMRTVSVMQADHLYGLVHDNAALCACMLNHAKSVIYDYESPARQLGGAFPQTHLF